MFQNLIFSIINRTQIHYFYDNDKVIPNKTNHVLVTSTFINIIFYIRTRQHLDQS